MDYLKIMQDHGITYKDLELIIGMDKIYIAEYLQRKRKLRKPSVRKIKALLENPIWTKATKFRNEPNWKEINQLPKIRQGVAFVDKKAQIYEKRHGKIEHKIQDMKCQNCSKFIKNEDADYFCNPETGKFIVWHWDKL